MKATDMLVGLQTWLDGDDAAFNVIAPRLSKFGFADPTGAARRLRGVIDAGLTSHLAINSLSRVIGLLAEVADPDAGLIDFERFVQRASDRSELFQFLDDNPRALDVLVRLFASSRYLTETVLRDPQTLRELTQHRRLADLKSREEFLEGRCRWLARFATPLRSSMRCVVFNGGSCCGSGLATRSD